MARPFLTNVYSWEKGVLVACRNGALLVTKFSHRRLLLYYLVLISLEGETVLTKKATMAGVKTSKSST